MPSTLEQVHEQHITDLISAIQDCSCKVDELKKALLRQLPSFVDERAYLIAPETNTSVATSPQVSGIIRVHTVIAYAVNASTLILGDRQIPLPAGVNVLRDLGILLQRRDVRKLTQTPAGAMSLEITGVEIPERGMW